MTFSTERNDALWWLMVSADVNANRALLAVPLADETQPDCAPGWVGGAAIGAANCRKRAGTKNSS